MHPLPRRTLLRALLAAPGAGCLPTARAESIALGDRDLQTAIDATPPHAVLECDPNRELLVAKTVVVRRPLTLVGLRARLREKLGGTPLLRVEAPGFSLLDFQLTGNGDSVSQDERAPLVLIQRGDFRVERGVLLNSSKDGIAISATDSPEDVVGGVVRDLVGRKVIRDTVSISGSDRRDGHRIRNVLVDNVRCYGSERRGAVEVSDGTDNVTVRKVYAEDSVYGVDVQDHSQPGQINRSVVVEDVYALRCRHALRTANRRLGHRGLSIRGIVAEACTRPLQISHTDDVHVSDVRIVDHPGGKPGDEAAAKDARPPLDLSDCRGVTLRDALIQDTWWKGPGCLIVDCDQALLDGLTLREGTESLANAVCYRLTSAAAFTGLRITGVSAPRTTAWGILLEAAPGAKGRLDRYAITGNLATVEDRIRGVGAVLRDNQPSPP